MGKFQLNFYQSLIINECSISVTHVLNKSSVLKLFHRLYLQCTYITYKRECNIQYTFLEHDIIIHIENIDRKE